MNSLCTLPYNRACRKEDKLKLLIIGATGGLGKELVHQALIQDHEVTVMARNPSVVTFEDRHLQVVQGDVLDARSLGRAVDGQEAVLNALGTPTPREVTTLLEEGTKNVVEAMEQQGVRRLVCVTILGTGDSGQRHGSLFYRLFVLGFFVKPMLEDKERQEEVIRGSRLDWTIVRPPRYTNEPKSGGYRVIGEGEGRVGKIGKADLADFMLDQLYEYRYIRRTAVVGY
jgi:putative NADH-flavin reductase